MPTKFWMLIACALLVGCSNERVTSPVTNQTAESNRSGVAGAEPKNASSEADSAQEPGTPSEIVIDVRSKEEWDTGHVEQAVHIPHTQIAQRIAEATDDKTAKIVVYCAVGGRAGKAKETLEELGFTNVENAGGYDDVKSRYANP